MRVRTDEKRQAILEAAGVVISALGYEKASMAAIAREAVVAKQTLYSYFDSKEELFSAMMVKVMESRAVAVFNMLDDEGGEVGASLESFGRAYIQFATSPEILGLTRVAVSEGGLGDLGPRLYANGPMRGWSAIADTLRRWSLEGRLEIADPLTAAMHLKGLLDAGVVEPRLYGARPLLTPDDAVRNGVRIFLAGYLPGKRPRRP